MYYADIKHEIIIFNRYTKMSKKASKENNQTILDLKKTPAELLQFFNTPPKFKNLHPSIIAKYENKLAHDCELAGHPNCISESLDCYDRGYINTTLELKEFNKIQLAIGAYLQSVIDNNSKENKKIILHSLEKLEAPLDRILNALENRSQNLSHYINIIEPFKKKNPAAKYLCRKLFKQQRYVDESLLLISTYYKHCLETRTKLLESIATKNTIELDSSM